MTLLELQENLRNLVAGNHEVQNVWITAELSDVGERGGHCYMELLQKDPSTGQTIAKARATIWANSWKRISAEFFHATGQRFASGLQVMVRVSAGYHVVYGMSLNITAVNSAYTMGERERRRREILEQLKRDGVIDLNKQCEFPRPTRRIAVITSATAAGYGDFRNQLLLNDRRLKFKLQLFPAIVQGSQTAQSVIAALDKIAQEQDKWDCVCIIRGGGASTDLDGFDDYALAANVAQFPLPVIVGIGHERDTTVLDYIACQRVKTPTAAAEFLLGLGDRELAQLQSLAAEILQNVSDILAGAREQLSYISGKLPAAPGQALANATRRLDRAAMALTGISASRIQPLHSRLDRMADAIGAATTVRTQRAAMQLDKFAAIIDALSPQATLRRGFSITRVVGVTLTDPSQAPAGSTIETILANGKITSIVS